MSSKEQKEYYRRKLEEARRADLEKYGEVPDDFDLDGYVRELDESGGEVLDAEIVSEENKEN